LLARARHVGLARRAAAPRVALADGEERPLLWRDSAACPGDDVLQPETPPAVDPRKFLHGERLFHRLLRFWRLLWWPAPGTADAGGSVTWVELVLFYELLPGTELPHWVSGVPGGQRGHYRYPEDGPDWSRATVQEKAQLLASATWALEALVGHVVPADAKRPPNI